MKCNLLFELWTFLRLDVVYGEVMRRMPGPIHWLMWQVAIFAWCSLSFVSVVVPVKVTAHIGPTVEVRKGETQGGVAHRAHEALQQLIDRTVRRRHRSFGRGLQQRWLHLRKQLFGSKEE